MSVTSLDTRHQATTGRAWPPLARVAAAGLGFFWITVIVTAALNPGYRHVREAISALAATDAHGAWLMIAGFLASAVGMVCVGVVYGQRLGSIVSGRIVSAMTVLVGLLLVVSGLARQDCSEALPSCIDHGEAPLATTHFWVHQYAGLGMFLLLVASFFVLARALRRSDGWAYLAIPTRVPGAICLAVMMPFFTIGYGDYDGLVQRALLAVLFGWPILVAGLAARPQVR